MKRVLRLRGTPHTIAAGAAAGAAVSFLPFPGLHFGLGALLAFAIRGSVLASAVGTVIGNFWTFPFIWLASYRIGRWLGAGEGAAVSGESLGRRLTGLAGDVWSGNFAKAAADGWPVFQPMLVGGGLMAIVVFVVFYFAIRNATAVYQSRRRARLAEVRASWRRRLKFPGAEESKA